MSKPMTTAKQCAEMRDDAIKTRVVDPLHALALLDSYEALVQAAREELGPTGHTQGCRFVLNGRRECDCIGQQVRQYDGEAGCRAAEPKAFTAEQVAAVFDPANDDKTCKELRESIAEPPKRRMRHHLGKNTTSTHHTWEPHDEIVEGHSTIESCTRCGCQPVPDAAPSPIWDRMEQNSTTVAAMPDYVKGSPTNERAAPSPRAWVCVEKPSKSTLCHERDTIGVEVLPLPTAKVLGEIILAESREIVFSDGCGEAGVWKDRLGAAILRALGVSDDRREK